MKHVKKSVLLWYSPREMYELVVGIEQYPAFLPWCEKAEALAADDAGMTARLHLAFAGVRQAFTTRNTHVDEREVHMKLVDGPFSQLEGTWRFTPLQTPGAATAESTACKVEFSLQYAFSSRPLAMVISPVFDRIANTFVDAFVKRAEQVYGAR